MLTISVTAAPTHSCICWLQTHW